MTIEYLKQVAEITSRTNTLKASEIAEIQISASVLEFVNQSGGIEQLKRKVMEFLEVNK